MAAPTFGVMGTNLSGSATSAAVPVPASVVSGSLVVMAMFLDGAAQTVTPPAGWTAAENCPINVSGGSHGLHVFWHRASGSESGTYTFTWGSSTFRDAFAARFDTAVSSGTPFDSSTGAAFDSGTVNNSPSVSTTSLGADRLDIWVSTNWSGGTWTAPTGFTKHAQSTENVLTIASHAHPTAGSTGSVVGSCTGTDRMTAFVGALIGTTAGSTVQPPLQVRMPQAMFRAANY